jgi:flagellar biogenesis protein FliO
MITLACALIVSAPFPVDVKLGDSTVTPSTFELPITRGALAVQNAKTVQQPNGDVLYFVTNASGPDSDADFANGPVAHLRTRDMPRGFAILVTPREGASVSLGSGVIAAKSAQPMAEKRSPIAEGPSPVAEGRSPMPESRSPSTDGPSAMAEKPIAEAPVMPRASSAYASAKPIDDRSSSPLRNFGLLAVLLAAGAAVVVYGKKKKLANGDSGGIELIAVKALGAKQRLAVIDACGDRLLIATSEQGVQLLSKLEGGTGVHKIAPDFLATLQQAEANNASPVTHVTQVNTSKDLAGLVQLRARRATWASTEPLV